MDDENSRSEKLRHIIRFLESMDEQSRKEYLAHCEMEIRYSDGWSAEYYRDYLEAAKYV
jgi:hypothetical protein